MAKPKSPQELMVECKKCKNLIVKRELEENFKICPKCGYYFRLSAKERISQLLEPGSFKEFNKNIKSTNFLNFFEYDQKLKISQEKTKLQEAVLTYEGLLGPYKVILCVLDFEFMGGSMGSVVGEKITLAIERSLKKKLPLIIVSASGGARMQEGIISLMQMAKTSAALAKLHIKKLPFISILTDPTTGGVAASFAMLGDIIIAEPGALIGFAGPRVIEQTIKEKLPEGFQTSEFLLKCGMIDMIVERRDLKNTLIKLLKFFTKVPKLQNKKQ